MDLKRKRGRKETKQDENILFDKTKMGKGSRTQQQKKYILMMIIYKTVRIMKRKEKVKKKQCFS